jgi:hypothetical protein
MFVRYVASRAGYDLSMRRLLVIAGIVLLGLAPAAGATKRTPVLTLVQRTPTVFRGAGFLPLERVSVSAGTATVHARSSRSGAFLTPALPTDRCFAGRIVAVGAHGDRAVLRLPPILCAPAGGGSATA